MAEVPDPGTCTDLRPFINNSTGVNKDSCFAHDYKVAGFGPLKKEIAIMYAIRNLRTGFRSVFITFNF